MIRNYTARDQAQVLALLKKNTPAYFDASEEADLVHYLDKEVEDYFVVEENQHLIGAGGINYFPAEKMARLSWDLIHPLYHGKGIGKSLTQFRVEYIRQNPAIELIVVRTSQLVYGFYEKMGFELEKIEEDYWAKGYHLYQMRLPLSHCYQ